MYHEFDPTIIRPPQQLSAVGLVPVSEITQAAIDAPETQQPPDAEALQAGFVEPTDYLTAREEPVDVPKSVTTERSMCGQAELLQRIRQSLGGGDEQKITKFGGGRGYRGKPGRRRN